MRQSIRSVANSSPVHPKAHIAEAALAGRLIIVESVQPSDRLVKWVTGMTFTQLPKS